jgi:hypothetical protein
VLIKNGDSYISPSDFDLAREFEKKSVFYRINEPEIILVRGESLKVRLCRR